MKIIRINAHIVLAIAIFGLSLVIVSCNGSSDEQLLATSEVVQTLPVQTITVKPHLLPEALQAVGQAEGSREVEVHARVSGILEQKLHEEGKYIQAGKPLFKIERAPYEIAVQRAKATLAQRQAQLEQARREAQRLQPLAKEKAIAQREYDDATTNARLAEAAVDASRADLRDAELNLSYTAINAAVAGVAGRSLKSQGALITAGSESLLTTIVQTDPIWIRFSITEAELAKVRASAAPEVNVLSEDGSVQIKGGQLNFAASTVDAQTGAVSLRAEFPNAQLSILPGQFVRVQVLTDPILAYSIPQTAVTQDEDGHKTWVVREGLAVTLPIKTGSWMGKEWVVLQGLTEGDQVIIDNLIKLSPGMPVAPQSDTSSESLPR